MNLAESLANDGFAVVHDELDERQLGEWRLAIKPVDWVAHQDSNVRMHGARNLLALPTIQQLVSGCQISDLVATVLGRPGIPVRGILFNKVQILHSSSKAIQPTSRRIVHLEFASEPLQNGLEWCPLPSQAT